MNATIDRLDMKMSHECDHSAAENGAGWDTTGLHYLKSECILCRRALLVEALVEGIGIGRRLERGEAVVLSETIRTDREAK